MTPRRAGDVDKTKFTKDVVLSALAPTLVELGLDENTRLVVGEGGKGLCLLRTLQLLPHVRSGWTAFSIFIHLPIADRLKYVMAPLPD